MDKLDRLTTLLTGVDRSGQGWDFSEDQPVPQGTTWAVAGSAGRWAEARELLAEILGTTMPAQSSPIEAAPLTRLTTTWAGAKAVANRVHRRCYPVRPTSFECVDGVVLVPIQGGKDDGEVLVLYGSDIDKMLRAVSDATTPATPRRSLLPYEAAGARTCKPCRDGKHEKCSDEGAVGGDVGVRCACFSLHSDAEFQK